MVRKSIYDRHILFNDCTMLNKNSVPHFYNFIRKLVIMMFLYPYTGMRHLTTFWSVIDHICDSGPIRLQDYNTIL